MPEKMPMTELAVRERLVAEPVDARYSTSTTQRLGQGQVISSSSRLVCLQPLLAVPLQRSQAVLPRLLLLLRGSLCMAGAWP